MMRKETFGALAPLPLLALLLAAPVGKPLQVNAAPAAPAAAYLVYTGCLLGQMEPCG